jgi:cytochrome c oxidase cbb3-type subunit 3
MKAALHSVPHACRSCSRARRLRARARDFSRRPGNSTPSEPAHAPRAQPARRGPAAAACGPPRPSPYDENAYAVSQGKRLYRWYNCNGCHAGGGGGIGPALMDAEWRYGGDPAQVFASIVQGRPNGMPSFGGHIPKTRSGSSWPTCVR